MGTRHETEIYVVRRYGTVNMAISHGIPVISGGLTEDEDKEEVSARVHHTEEYRWWHPRDHVFSAWEGDSEPGKYIARIHLVHELNAYFATVPGNMR